LDPVEHDMRVNFLGTLRVTRAFLPQLQESHGAIVNVLTPVALASMPTMATYSASKAAAYSMTQSLRALLAGRRVRVHGIFPGAVDTDMIRDVDMPQTPEIARAALEALDAGEIDIFPDPMSQQLHEL
jgi:short-subunit dehydrogenase